MIATCTQTLRMTVMQQTVSHLYKNVGFKAALSSNTDDDDAEENDAARRAFIAL